MKITVSGGGGFVGSHAAEYMAKMGNQVVVIDNLSRASLLKSRLNMTYNWNYLAQIGGITRVEGDILDANLVSSEIKDSDAIIHTAGQTAVTASLADPITDMKINTLGTLHVLEAARKSKNDPTVIFCSTNKVYGDNVNQIPIKANSDSYSFESRSSGISEDFPVDRTGHTPYGSSKLAADIYVQDYAHTYGLKTVVFRMSCIYGTRQFGVEDQGWVAWFTIASILGKKITIYGDGKQVRDVLYIDDLVRAFESAIRKSKKLRGEVFNIGGGPRNTLSLLQLLRILEELIERKPRVKFSGWRPHDQKVYISDIRKVQQALGWSPVVPPREGILRVINWVKENRHAFNEAPSCGTGGSGDPEKPIAQA